MDLLPGITPGDIAALGKIGAQRRVSAKEEAAQEFVSVFLNELLKDSFAEGADGISRSNLSVVKEVLMEKLSRELMQNDSFAFKEALSKLGYNQQKGCEDI
jgi:Rod binding domain-containing protein